MRGDVEQPAGLELLVVGKGRILCASIKRRRGAASFHEKNRPAAWSVAGPLPTGTRRSPARWRLKTLTASADANTLDRAGSGNRLRHHAATCSVCRQLEFYEAPGLEYGPATGPPPLSGMLRFPGTHNRGHWRRSAARDARHGSRRQHDGCRGRRGCGVRIPCAQGNRGSLGDGAPTRGARAGHRRVAHRDDGHGA